MSKKNKQNMGSNNNFTAGNDINQKFNKSNNNNIDKTINNNKTIIIKPSVSQNKYKEPETYRPNLKDREGDIVTGVAYISKKYDDKKYTYCI